MTIEELYEQYHQRIFKRIYYMVHDVHLAQDLSQDTWLKAYQAFPKLRTNSQYYGWLYTIATRVAYDATRRCQGQAAHEGYSLDREDAPDLVDEASDPASYGDCELIALALQKLMPSYRRELARDMANLPTDIKRMYGVRRDFTVIYKRLLRESQGMLAPPPVRTRGRPRRIAEVAV